MSSVYKLFYQIYDINLIPCSTFTSLTHSSATDGRHYYLQRLDTVTPFPHDWTQRIEGCPGKHARLSDRSQRHRNVQSFPIRYLMASSTEISHHRDGTFFEKIWFTFACRDNTRSYQTAEIVSPPWLNLRFLYDDDFQLPHKAKWRTCTCLTEQIVSTCWLFGLLTSGHYVGYWMWVTRSCVSLREKSTPDFKVYVPMGAIILAYWPNVRIY